MMHGPYLTQSEFCEMFKVKKETLRKWRYAGKVKAVKLAHKTIRIPMSEVERLKQEAAQ